MRALASDKDTICQQLWNVDVNRLHRGVEFDILPQINVSQRSNEDKAGNRLIYYLKWELMRRRPTFRTFTGNKTLALVTGSEGPFTLGWVEFKVFI